MKKTIILLVLIFSITISFSQEKKTFPHKVFLKNTNGDKVSSKTFANFNNPLVIIFIEPKKIHYIGEKLNLKEKLTHPSILFLNSLNETVNDWKNKFNTKTIVVFHTKKIEGKKITNLIKENNWMFTSYFNTNRKLYKEIYGVKKIANQTLSIFNQNFENLFKKDTKLKYSNFYCKAKDGTWKSYCLDSNKKIIKQDKLLRESEDILEMNYN